MGGMAEGGAIGVTEAIDNKLSELKARAKKRLTEAEAQDAFGDLISTVGVINVASAAEAGYVGTLLVNPFESDASEQIHGKAKRAQVRTEKFVEDPAVYRDLLVTPKPPAEAPPATGILAKLKDWVIRIKEVLEGIAKWMKATSYTITVGAPWGISIAVTFNL